MRGIAREVRGKCLWSQEKSGDMYIGVNGGVVLFCGGVARTGGLKVRRVMRGREKTMLRIMIGLTREGICMDCSSVVSKDEEVRESKLFRLRSRPA